MSRQYNMYNVQCAEGWKQRIALENMHNIPYVNVRADDDDASSMVSGSTNLTSLRGTSVASTTTLRKVAEPQLVHTLGLPHAHASLRFRADR